MVKLERLAHVKNDEGREDGQGADFLQYPELAAIHHGFSLRCLRRARRRS
jgi:hypothetical protein